MAVDWFLQVAGITGDSTDDEHRNEIEVLAWSWGVVNSVSSAGHVGAGLGKPSFQDLHVVSRIGSASPHLFLACATGQHLASATLTGVRPGPRRLDFLVYRLADVVIGSVQHNSGDEQQAPVDRFGMSYRRVDVSYLPTGPDGRPGTPVEAGFDLDRNRPT
jgi:type VI secretion system secreted protein Hcp